MRHLGIPGQVVKSKFFTFFHFTLVGQVVQLIDQVVKVVGQVVNTAGHVVQVKDTHEIRRIGA